MDNKLSNFFLALLSTCVALIIGEGVIRFVEPDQIVADPVFGRRAVSLPGWDADGWKNPSVVEQADIVAIGDSQTEGDNAGVRETWPYVLGQVSSTSVYEMALGGYGPVQYEKLVGDALRLHPKVVIVGFYLGNDVLDAYSVVYGNERWKALRDPNFNATTTNVDQADYRTIMSTGLDPNSITYKLYEVRLWIRSHSKLYAAMGDATRKFREKMNVAKTLDEKLDDVTSYAKSHPEVVYVVDDRKIGTVLSPAYRLNTVSLDQPNTKEGWRLTRDLFLSIKKRLDSLGVRFVVLVIPTKESTYLEHMKRTAQGVPQAFAAYARQEESLARSVREFCDKKDMECVFALPALAGALDRGEKIYGVTMDGHPIASGYRVIGEAVSAYLQKEQEVGN